MPIILGHVLQRKWPECFTAPRQESALLELFKNLWLDWILPRECPHSRRPCAKWSIMIPVFLTHFYSSICLSSVAIAFLLNTEVFHSFLHMLSHDCVWKWKPMYWALCHSVYFKVNVVFMPAHIHHLHTAQVWLKLTQSKDWVSSLCLNSTLLCTDSWGKLQSAPLTCPQFHQAVVVGYYYNNCYAAHSMPTPYISRTADKQGG